MRALVITAAFLALASPAVASCHIAGDSITLGLSQSLGGCTRDAKGGIPASAVVAKAASGGRPDYLIVSAGSNDSLPTRSVLQAMGGTGS